MAVILALAAPASGGVALDKVAAVVNKEAITWSELYRAMEFELKKQGKPFTDEQKKEIFRDNEASFLREMVNIRLQLQEARNVGIKVAEQELNAAVSDIKRRFAMDDAALESALKTDGFASLRHYRDVLREQMLISRVIEQEVRSKIKAEAGKEEYCRLRQIFLRKTEGGPEALEVRAQEVLQKLSEGEEFGSLAVMYSDDPAAKSTGGGLGLVKKEHLAKEFLTAIEGLKPGDVSRPFHTEGGLHILRVEGIWTSGELKQEENFQKSYGLWLEGLNEKAFIEIRI